MKHRGEKPANDNNNFEDYLSLAEKAHGAEYARIAAQKHREEELKARGVKVLPQKRK